MVMMSLLLLLLPLITKSLSVSYDWQSEELRLIHHEIGSLKDENHKQNIEIASLKETVQQQNKTINRQEKTIQKLFTGNYRISKNDRPVSSAAKSRRKRPVRLLPVSILYGKKNNSTVQQNLTPFYGPPTNCSDLYRLGYTLNGYYLVKNPAFSDDFKKTTKIETVFCAFKQEEDHNPLLVQQEVIPPPSSLNLLSSSSFFSSPQPKPDQDIFNDSTNAFVAFNSTTSTFSSSQPKLDQKIFSQTRNATFNSSSSTALIKKGDPSSCIPLWQLKVGQPAGIRCLSVEHMKLTYSLSDRPVLEKCKNRNPAPEQKWSMIESENAGVRICQEKSNQCLTFASGMTYLSDFPHVSLKKRDKKSKGQLFKMNNETSEIMIVESGSCLVGLLRTPPYVPGVGVHSCNETTDSITIKEWSVVPLNNCL